MSKEFILFFTLIFVAQLAVWFQINGQFIWPSFTRNELMISLLGAPISWAFIKSAKYGYITFEGVLWPQRLIGFATGIILFSLLTWWFLDEGINTKTTVCLIPTLSPFVFPAAQVEGERATEGWRRHYHKNTASCRLRNRPVCPLAMECHIICSNMIWHDII